MPYEAKPDIPLLPGERIDTASPLYQAFAADAEKRGMSQAAFSSHLGEYVRRSRPATPAPAPAPAAAAPKPAPGSFAKLPVREQFAHALANAPTRPRVEQTRFIGDKSWASRRG
jgi:hypothetical protein